MTNWRELPSGKKLDRVIAEKMGFEAKLITIDRPLFRTETYLQVSQGWFIVKDDVLCSVYAQPTAESAWYDFFRYDSECGGYSGLYSGCWSEKVDDALTLPIDHAKWFWVLTPYSRTGEAVVRLCPYNSDEPEYESISVHGLAFCMCEAWLKYKEHEQNE